MGPLEKKLVEQIYTPVYFDRLPENVRAWGSRFLISRCPEKAEDVRILFLNDNPGNFVLNEAPDKPVMTDCDFWFEEDWGDGNGGREVFRRFFYLISRKAEDDGWSYSRQFHELNNQITIIPTGKVLGAYGVPLRTKNEDLLPKTVKNLAFRLWKKILDDVLKPKIVFTTGKIPYDIVCAVLGAGAAPEKRIPTGWGNVSYKYREARGVKIVSLPQLTRYRLFCSNKPEIVSAVDVLMSRIF